jgi:hypothetical protein
MGNNDVVTHDPSVGVRRRHLPNFVGEEGATQAVGLRRQMAMVSTVAKATQAR